MERHDGRHNAFKWYGGLKALRLHTTGFANALQGKYDEAEPCRRRSLEIMEQLHGSDHLGVAEYIAKLAVALEAQVRSKGILK